MSAIACSIAESIWVLLVSTYSTGFSEHTAVPSSSHHLGMVHGVRQQEAPTGNLLCVMLFLQLLQRAQGADQSNWSLLKVAIVDLRNNVFIGRLFFGNPDTGEVKWDCDCRPSDGCYLAIKAGCPVYVSRRVWDQAALPLRASSVYK